jgi:hypothetical protein
MVLSLCTGSVLEVGSILTHPRCGWELAPVNGRLPQTAVTLLKNTVTRPCGDNADDESAR